MKQYAGGCSYDGADFEKFLENFRKGMIAIDTGYSRPNTSTFPVEQIPNKGFPTWEKTAGKEKKMIINNIEFKDISSESFREYLFDGEEVLRIDNPVGLNVSTNGHRVFTEDGFSYYIPHYYKAIRWKPKTGKAPFQF